MNKDSMIVVYDCEPGYAFALSDYINRKNEAGFVSCGYTDNEKFSEFLYDNPGSYVLAGEGFEMSFLPDGFKGKNIIVLVDNTNDVPEAPWIYKYQPASKIMKEINSMTGGLSDDVGGCEVYTVFSADGNRNSSAYARQLAEEYSNKGPVLFMDLSLLPPVDTDVNGISMSDILYFAKQGKNRLQWKIKSFAKEKGITYIRPVKCFMDLYEMDEKDIVLILDVLANSGLFASTVINLSLFGAPALSILTQSGKIFLMSDGNDNHYEEEFISELSRMKRSDIVKKAKVINIG
ncbi:MAG: hypothetical protein SPL99_00830 [Catonella sp.]|nr:hypothetical protein [Catonella sp.]MDY6357798.1 hypothetical protein [Catonella sp.]